MAVKIRCISKDGGNHYNAHEAITHLGWINENTGETGKCTRLTMVKFIEDKDGKAYVKDSRGNVAYLYVRTYQSGNKFVQTYADSKYTNNLLNLLECIS